MSKTKLFLWVAGVIVLFGLVFWVSDYFALGKKDQFGETEGQKNIQTSHLQAVELETSLVAQGLFVPWSLVFPSEERILVTERNGNIRQILNGKLQNDPLIHFEEISQQDEEGLMGMVLDPNYEENKWLYVCLARKKDDTFEDVVLKLVDNGESISVAETLLDSIPAAQFHAGCRLQFGPDGNLYITTGDATQKELAQDMNSLAGKILRIYPDGTIPEDNPFSNSPIYSFGHRNPQGIAWNPVSGSLFSTEHGPSIFDGPAGGDEVNKIEIGGNYGWPLVSHEESLEGTISPELVFTPAVAPASAMFYDSAVIPQFQNNFFFGALKGEGIVRVVFSQENPDKVDFYEKIETSFGRIREVVQGPDGSVYFTTSNRDDRGTIREHDDKIYKIGPKSL